MDTADRARPAKSPPKRRGLALTVVSALSILAACDAAPPVAAPVAISEPAPAPVAARPIVVRRLRSLNLGGGGGTACLLGGAAADALDAIAPLRANRIDVLTEPPTARSEAPPSEELDDDGDDGDDEALSLSQAIANSTLIVVTEATLRSGADERHPVLRAVSCAAADGAVVFVDEWKGDTALLREIAGFGSSAAYEIAPDSPLLTTPHLLGGLPPAHSDPDPRIVGVDVAGKLRVIATKQNTLSHGCGCDKAEGRARFGENLARLAAAQAAGEKPSDAPIDRISASLEGRTLRATALVRGSGKSPAAARIELVTCDGRFVAALHAGGRVAFGEERTLTLEAEVPVPFDVLEHRLIVTLDDDEERIRAVVPVDEEIGAPNLVLRGSGVVAPGAAVAVDAALATPGAAQITPSRLSTRLVAADGREIAATDGIGLVVPADAPLSRIEGAGPRFVVTSDHDVFGRDEVELPVTAHERRLTAHIFADLPIHRPGDRVSLRLLLTTRPDGRPAPSVPVQFRLGRCAPKVATTESHGVATAELEIPWDEPSGDVDVRAYVEETCVAAGTLRIERFELPRFQVSVARAADADSAADEFTASVVARRFDGTPVPHAEIEALVRVAGAAVRPVATWRGTTDAEGRAQVRVTRPAADVPGAGAWERGVLDVAVTDSGGRRVAAAEPLFHRQAASPPTAVLVGDGIATPHHALVRTGLAAGARVIVQAAAGTADTAPLDAAPPAAYEADEQGFISVPLPSPQQAGGWMLAVGGERVHVTPRPVGALGTAAAFVREGTPIRIALPPGTGRDLRVAAYDGQVCVAAATVAEGTVTDLPLPAGVSGEIVLRVRDASGAAISSTSLVVATTERLTVRVEPSRSELRPGDPVELAVSVRDLAGAGTPAALALRVCDEAALSLVPSAGDPLAVSLALGTAAARRDPRSRISFGELLARAARGDLGGADARLLETMVNRHRPAPTEQVRESLPARRKAYDARVQTIWVGFLPGVKERFEASLARADAPAPSGAVRDVADALRALAARGEFGALGLLDPWGGTLRLRGRGDRYPTDLPKAPAATTTSTTGDAPPSEDAGAPVEAQRSLTHCWELELASDGPDGRRGTADDCRETIDALEAVRLHHAWVTAHGHEFDLESHFNGTIGIGGGAGGSFGSRKGGRRNLKAGGGGSIAPEDGLDAAPLRCEFPETLFFAPLVLTDEDGRAQVSITAPGSLTTWRVDALAHDASGRAGEATARFRTTIPFSAEIDAPGACFVGDEITVPVVIRWADGAARAPATLTVSADPAAALLSEPALTVTAPAAGDAVAWVRLAPQRGAQSAGTRLRVSASSGGAQDRSERAIETWHRGVPSDLRTSARRSEGAMELSVARPKDAVPGSLALELRLRTDVASELLEGAEALVRAPHGCFEQTSSALFPDVLLLKMIDRADAPDASAALLPRLRRHMNDGVERLLSFEIEGGGFDWFGRPKAKLLLSAYGLHEWIAIRDVSGFRETGRAVVRRTAEWIAGEQRDDGSFAAEGVPYEWKRDGVRDIAATAYAGWALVRADAGSNCDVAGQKAAAYVSKHIVAVEDPYTLALCTALLVEAEPGSAAAKDALSRLMRAARQSDGTFGFDAVGTSAFHGKRVAAETEALAVIAIAAARSGDVPRSDLDGLLAAITRRRTAGGAWATTHATVLALWAIADAAPDPLAPGTVITVRPEHGAARSVVVGPEGTTIPPIDLTDVLAAAPANAAPRITIEAGGAGSVSATLALRYALPFSAARFGSRGPLDVSLDAPGGAIRRGETTSLQVAVRNIGDAPVAMPLIEIPLPAGVEIEPASLRDLRAAAAVERVEADSAGVAIYLRELAPGAVFKAAPAVRPRLAGTLLLAPVRARPYYEPDRAAFSQDLTLTVR